MDSTSRTEFLEDVDDPPDPDVVETDPTKRYVRYKDVLGRGAFKTVYKAFDEVDGIEVAWCQVNIDAVVRGCTPDLESALYDEVNMLKVVHHKHIIKMYKSWVDDEKKTINIITELFNSGSVRQYREKHKKVDMKALKGWARQILLGLDYLHSHSPPIIHRDVKCDNIFINGNHGEVKIGDLGLATVMEQASLHSVLGTPQYMAPEIYNEDYNELVDIYSFGMCMLEMTTNESPYIECTNCAQVYKKVVSGVMPASLSKVKDLEMKKFIERCLGPVAQRLPAKELLKDPFLQPKDSAAAGYCQPKQVSAGTVLTPHKKESSTEQHMLPENRITTTAVESHPVPMVEVQRVRRGKEFKLQGVKEDEKSVSFKLKFLNAEVKDTVYFSFYLESDTAISVASEMFDEVKLADLTVLFVAELIDVSITRLVPDWKPCVPIDQLVVTHECAASLSNPDAGTFSEDRYSDAGTFSEENYIKSRTGRFMHADSGFMMYNGCIQDVCSRNRATNVSTVGNGEDNFELKDMSLELEMIELEYQQALEEISKKRHEAIMALKNRVFSQKKMVPAY
ncbi:hypothetical protein C5167_036461 [Papaver somniferum]|uniref:non-specific serine/threonine protein kinase n=1 Tax=Papaver somniferum TaxID=3469 RepID=A0A4Y7I752_PAPSO|nr:probable serine/threonine-protein kinase WNK6 [Papaver somniferum]XP_026383195.1 probable serine/threonine-protein kinase WNK6 [Papaver somniferum]XP_026383201.1 probable serine/threonine-protein kinase WNK6 [Papaver somniferum]RZC43522.1 hypothetical protein C5167_036461 [Papaver somniferum]